MPPHNNNNSYQEEAPLVPTNGGGDNDSSSLSLTARRAFESANVEASRQYHDSRTSANHKASSQEDWHQSEGGLLKVSSHSRRSESAPNFDLIFHFFTILPCWNNAHSLAGNFWGVGWYPDILCHCGRISGWWSVPQCRAGSWFLQYFRRRFEVRFLKEEFLVLL